MQMNEKVFLLYPLQIKILNGHDVGVRDQSARECDQQPR